MSIHKSLYSVLVIAFLFSLSGCGDSSSPGDSSTFGTSGILTSSEPPTSFTNSSALVENTQSIINITPQELEEQSVSILSSEDNPLGYQESFKPNDIELIRDGGNYILENNSNRKFGSLLGRYRDDENVFQYMKLTFPQVIEPHSRYYLSAFPSADTMEIVETQPLWNPGIAFKGNVCELNEDGTSTVDGEACYDTPTEAETGQYSVAFANMKHFLNSVHALPLYKALAHGTSYGGHDFEVVGFDYYKNFLEAEDQELYLYQSFLHIILSEHSIGVRSIRYNRWAEGIAAVRGSSNLFGHEATLNRWIAVWAPTVLKLERWGYDTIMHETLHTYGFWDGSSMCSGVADVGYADAMAIYITTYYASNEVPVEEVPKIVFITDQASNGETIVRVFSASGEQTPVSVEVLSAAELTADIDYHPSHNRIRLNFPVSPSMRFYLRLFDEHSEQIMTQELYPADVDLQPFFSSDSHDYFVIDDAYWNQVIDAASTVGSEFVQKGAHAEYVCRGVAGSTSGGLAEYSATESIYDEHFEALEGYGLPSLRFLSRDPDYTIFDFSDGMETTNVGRDTLVPDANMLCKRPK